MDENNIIYGENKYGKYAIPADTHLKHPVKMAMRGEVHEEATIQYIINNCGGGAIIHAGLFYGDFLPAFAKTGNKVFGFEPVKRFYDCAQLTLDLNFPEGNHDVEIFNYGLSDEETTKNIMHTDAGGLGMGGSALYDYDTPEKVKMLQELYDYDPDIKPEQIEETQVVTLDSIIPLEWQSKVSVLHLDIEGLEEKALKGALNIIRQSKPIILVETWKGEKDLETDFYQKEIYPLGYSLHDKIHRNAILKIKD
jgi:FkbM family methyltransferase